MAWLLVANTSDIGTSEVSEMQLETSGSAAAERVVLLLQNSQGLHTLGNICCCNIVAEHVAQCWW